ncbi:MAG TPA: DUF1365 domain-containing protein [Acidimicrobiia bacterium]|nr:DUF1365 domain-containing protein [Acidimicrobiia bacterium]
MNSALYAGTLYHRRVGSPSHEFRFPLAMPFLDLAELDEVFARHPLWSRERRNVVRFRRADYLGDPGVPLDAAVRDLVLARTGRRPSGPIRMLTHVRMWGWLFNPLTIYFCMNATGTRAEALVLEVTNTPWHERHAYVIEGGEGTHTFGKELHVSPFLSMDQEYRLDVSTRGERMAVRLAAFENGVLVFDASLALRRREVTRAAMTDMLWRYPLLTLRISFGIYWQALRLWRKGTQVYAHPRRTQESNMRGAA